MAAVSAHSTYAGIALVVGALSLGTWLDARNTPARAQPPRSGVVVLAADFHVHAFLGDGALPPWDLRHEARRQGLDAIVVSNHNQVIAAQIAASLDTRDDAPLIIPAQEVTTPYGHVVAVGVRDTVDWRLDGRALIAAIHHQGGVAIAAHPVPDSWTSEDTAVLGLLDGAEVAHPLTTFAKAGRRELDEFFARARALNPTLAPIGSSDFHFASSPGYCRTYVLAQRRDAEAVLQAIRDGRTVAEERDGTLYGSAADVAMVQEHRSQFPRPASRPLTERLTALACLVGLLLVVLRSPFAGA